MTTPLVSHPFLDDAVGGIVDLALRPDTWLLATGPRLMVAAGTGFDVPPLPDGAQPQCTDTPEGV